jgi:hypothetical protein
VKGRASEALAVGIAAAAATKATRGSNFEAGAAGIAAGTVEFLTHSKSAAASAGTGARALAGNIAKSVGKEAAGNWLTSQVNKAKNWFEIK